MASKKKTAQTRKRSRPVKSKRANIDSKIIIVVFIAAVVIIAISLFLLFGGDKPEFKENPKAIIDTTKGIIELELYKDKTPKTVENFIKLANSGFYDGMMFHRIMDDFMIQAGNIYPDGTIEESPYGNIEFETYPDLIHEDGSISMASTGWGVGGSGQFFICDGAQSGLDGGYAVFGKTISGIEVVRDIADDPHDNSNPAGGGKPNEDIIIINITIQK